MNVLLIQPPEPIAPVAPMEPSPADSRLFAPPQELLGIRSYLRHRTAHTGHVIDCRLFTSLEKELVEAAAAIPAPRVVAVNTALENLGEAAATLDIIKRHFPDALTAVFGGLPSSIPGCALIPRADYGLAGDPEPILRNLLDYVDVEQRLRRVPGLIHADQENLEPFWLPSLKGLSLPEWDGIFWPAYQFGTPTVCRVGIRLSRGHTGLAPDRALGGGGEPLRLWSFDRVAESIQKCSASGITEVFVHDPPGFWTLERLNRWCNALKRAYNIQPWSLRLLPAVLTNEIADSLAQNQCHRVEFIIPSCDPRVLANYNCTVEPKDLAGTVALLESHGIRVHARFWLGSPEEDHGEFRRVLKAIRALNYSSYSLHPFPFRLDAPFYHAVADSTEGPALEDWMEWAFDPWTVDRPVPLWGSPGKAKALAGEMNRVQATVKRSPGRYLQRAAHSALSRDLLGKVGDKTSGWLPFTRSHKS